MTDQPGQPPAAGAPPAGTGEASRIQSLDERFGKIETEQQQQRGLLEQIRDSLTGRNSPPAGSAPAASPPAPAAAAAADMAEQMRQAVRDVHAEESAAGPGTPAPEKTPRETGRIGGKERLQRVFFGKDPQR